MVAAVRARLPSLDGLRALSIALVLVGHGGNFVFQSGPLLAFCGALAQVGVSIFFVISGFLITHLLLEEEDRTGGISLRAFYLRRALRILPPFLVYLGLLTIARATAGAPLQTRELAIAAGFLWNYLSPSGTFALGHSWSLAVEEQFYLLWPGLLVVLGRTRARRMALALIGLVPLVRIAQAFWAPGSRIRIPITLHTRVDTLMFGCLLALLWREERFSRWLLAAADRLFPVALAVLFLLSPALSCVLFGKYLMTVGQAVEGAAIAALLFWSVHGSHRGWFRLLNSRTARHLGVISYSLYLYQQPFLDPGSALAHRLFPLTLVAAWGAAELSYRGVELTAARARDLLGRRTGFRVGRPPAAAPTVPGE